MSMRVKSRLSPVSPSHNMLSIPMDSYQLALKVLNDFPWSRIKNNMPESCQQHTFYVTKLEGSDVLSVFIFSEYQPYFPFSPKNKTRKYQLN